MWPTYRTVVPARSSDAVAPSGMPEKPGDLGDLGDLRRCPSTEPEATGEKGTTMGGASAGTPGRLGGPDGPAGGFQPGPGGPIPG